MKKKIRHFFDYYLLQAILILAAVFAVFYFARIIAFDRKEVILSVMILNDSEELDIDLLEAELKDYLGAASEKQDITFSFLKTDVPYNEAIILTRLRAKSVDVIISDEEVFRKYAHSGVYAPLSGILDGNMLSSGKDKLVQETAGAPDGNEAADGKKTADYGWSLAENKKYVMLGGKCEKPVLGIAVNAMHKENAKDALEYFWKNE